MGRVEFQHKNVANIAIVTDSQGRILLKAMRTLQRFCYLRWIEGRCDFVKEFTSYEEAETAALKCCPIFHGTAGPVAQFGRARWVWGIGYTSY